MTKKGKLTGMYAVPAGGRRMSALSLLLEIGQIAEDYPVPVLITDEAQAEGLSLAENVLRGRWVLGVAGTHGKTTTSSMLAWILQDAGMDPGFLIGGVPMNFGVSARLGGTPFFVIEADEYDTAFCDKRSKFIHYRPRTAILNNLEFDHADIFGDLAAIETQFHHLVRTLPSNGLIVANGCEQSLERVLQRGCWTTVERFGTASGWEAGEPDAAGGFAVSFAGMAQGRVGRFELTGAHNRANALAALALGERAARTVGVNVQQLRVRVALITAAMVAVITAFCGGVGFVGLAAPHIARLAAGSSPRVVLPLATLIGALLCVLADVIARSIAPPIELPVGAITAVLGVPLLVSLVTRRVERA